MAKGGKRVRHSERLQMGIAGLALMAGAPMLSSSRLAIAAADNGHSLIAILPVAQSKGRTFPEEQTGQMF